MHRTIEYLNENIASGISFEMVHENCVFVHTIFRSNKFHKIFLIYQQNRLNV